MIAEHEFRGSRDRVRNALGRMADAIERLDGTREKFIGDAVFAIFGWPRAHDDDPVRAALAALAIRAALREPDDGGEPLEVRIGLATGEVVAAPGGSGAGGPVGDGRGDHDRRPDSSLARPGNRLDEATVRGGRRLAVDDRGSVVLRGQSSVVRLYALAGRSAWRRRAANPSARRAARRAWMEQAVAELPVVREEQEPFAVAIQSPHWEHPRAVLR